MFPWLKKRKVNSSIHSFPKPKWYSYEALSPRGSLSSLPIITKAFYVLLQYL